MRRLVRCARILAVACILASGLLAIPAAAPAAPRPAAPAGVQDSNNGDACSEATNGYGEKVRWCYTVREHDTNPEYVAYRAHFWCSQNGSPVPCNFDNQNAGLFYDYDGRQGWGPRDFYDGTGKTDVVFQGSWHLDQFADYMSSGFIRVRFRNTNHLGTDHLGCSQLTDLTFSWAMTCIYFL